MTFRVLLRMEVRPGAGENFEKAWHEGAGVITGQRANLGQWLCRGEDEPGVYHIISDWTDEKSFREYEHSPEHLAHRQTLHPYRLRGTMATATVLADLPGAAAS
ncbi:antibiotic biosynthesis monooxygenase [Actinoplanes sp. TFC3]|uniref:antibiotic biosynthesis monooxygenase family protein n=1 Tax=Actinoplanes sp. TFC3 TaxID=1710355 RepID=UPI00082C315A|nr:antibiotic biosynthesis monooxygenase family protein [Actinoplanes sp. TFC3]